MIYLGLVGNRRECLKYYLHFRLKNIVFHMISDDDLHRQYGLEYHLMNFHEF